MLVVVPSSPPWNLIVGFASSMIEFSLHRRVLNDPQVQPDGKDLGSTESLSPSSLLVVLPLRSLIGGPLIRQEPKNFGPHLSHS